MEKKSKQNPPLPPPFPLDRILREGVTYYCKNCNSTTRRGFFKLSGKRYCDNDECSNSYNKIHNQ